MHQRWISSAVALASMLGCALLASGFEPPRQPESLRNSEPAFRPLDTEEGFGDLEPILPAAYWDQPPAAVEEAAPRPAPRRTLRGSRSQLISSGSPIERLASTPHMFGDMLSLAGQVQVSGSGPELGRIDLPLAGGTRRLKVSENNLPIPTDRVFYTYSHFENALNAELFAGPNSFKISQPIDRHIVGVEKTFFDGWNSLEVRMPFTGGVDAVSPGGLTATTGSVGNLTLITKQLVAVGEGTALAIGLGIELPTGSDVSGGDTSGQYRVNNDSVHLLPYVGLLVVPNESMFFQGYLQLDAAASGNEVFLGPPGTLSSLGTLTEQNLLHFDLAGGAWLYSNTDAPLITGLAGIIELHYVTTVNEPSAGGGPDVITGYTNANQQWQFGNQYGRVDLLHLTAGLHTEFRNRTTLRVGAVAPLRAEPDRFFDAEVQVSVNHFW